MPGGTRQPRRSDAAAGSELGEAVGTLMELTGDGCEPTADVTEWKTRPLGQVTFARWSMPGEIAPGELGEGSDSVERGGQESRWWPAEPVTDPYERVLPADHRPAHDEPAHRGLGEQVHERLSLRPDARLCALVSGPSSASAPSISPIAVSASSAPTPSCESRRAIAVSIAGVVSSCSHQ